MSASREEIINEIRRLAAMNNGQPPGRRLFRRRTNIHPAEWQGVYWAIWSDALKEAGFQPNLKTEKLDEEFMLIKLAEACRHFEKFPSILELRLYRMSHREFPDVTTYVRHFGSPNLWPSHLALWAEKGGRDDGARARLCVAADDHHRAGRRAGDALMWLMPLLSWLGNFLGGPFAKAAVDAYRAKLTAENTADKIAADLAARELAVEERERALATQVLIAEQGNAFTRAVRPLWALPFVIYTWKVIIFDKVLALGSTDPLTGFVATLAVTVAAAYFGGHTLENVARIIKR